MDARSKKEPFTGIHKIKTGQTLMEMKVWLVLIFGMTVRRKKSY